LPVFENKTCILQHFALRLAPKHTSFSSKQPKIWCKLRFYAKRMRFPAFTTHPFFASKTTFERIDYLRPSGQLVDYEGTHNVKILTKNRQNTYTTYTRMGNGTESTYAYDRQRERLQGMLVTANGDSIMQTQYKYDPVDNILGLTNVITPKAPKKPKGFGGPGSMGGPDAGKEKEEKPLGGAFSHTYAYDELNRLVKAEGKAKGIGYAMDMSFGLMGEPLTKVQRTDSGSVAGSYALAYEYGDTDHPTGPLADRARALHLRRQRQSHAR